MSSSGKNNCWGFSYWPGSWWLNFMWDLALIFLNIHEPVPTLIYSSAFKNENRKTWLCARCYSHWSLAKEEILMNSNSLEQFRKILSLITDKKKKKDAPSHLFFPLCCRDLPENSEVFTTHQSKHRDVQCV